MILNTWILGLIVGQLTVFSVFVYGVYNAAQIYLKWDYNSSSEKQYRLEKRTYLVSALMKHALVAHIFLFVLTILALDEIAPMVVGAMCPVGVLASNIYGFPYLYLKIIAVFIYSTWLVFNYVDGQMDNYPLISVKYLLLIIIFPTIAFETVMLFLFAVNLNPQIITSCCGSVFNETNSGVPGLMSSVPSQLILLLLFAVVIAIVIRSFFTKDHIQQKKIRGFSESALWIVFYILAISAVISFISVYVYEMPTHKCPFCLLQQEYNYIGYPLYFFLFLATAAGINKGALEWVKINESVSRTIVGIQAKLGNIALYSMIGFLLFGFSPFFIYYAKTGRLI
jgi:hypothetical protein